MSTSSIVFASIARLRNPRHQHVDAGDASERRARRLERLAGKAKERIDGDEVL